ncbi:tRNA (N6-threonylcarbamoyladenosine(37)-N6)-methyltransferase TrmO [Psychrosphaera ytuae]|uniref:tRNA (N6-threonylcarbamoyladenosine(37)-N6)-methyltransferase TrmO n=1 Tax=Psychrosphaera ytuae TaxID=2820710 RepID=A0A975HIX8_9GAMM|nr:tRNA (N6-threonylcarbamoyladenosine(37)-N6)-methyltransferase TrmO [Psychrosphaera ytuae]QTH64722.1 tRNA (N6-threonylcarbamoyladenosine(37)-N6)-methyltransferase TrmO [Psychrosphaera ytuae]
MIQTHTIAPIATIQTPFKEKFGIPRQPNLVAAQGRLRFTNPKLSWDAIKGIEQHSHLWLLFLFDQHLDKDWKPQVRPPRLGGNEKVGVLATRSTFRPNNIGMSVVRLLKVESENNQPVLLVEGVDLLDGTPIVDIKPYIPYADSIECASSEMAESAPEALLNVVLSPLAEQKVETHHLSDTFVTLVKKVLEQDPRPTYKRTKVDDKIYGILLDEYNITWRVINCDPNPSSENTPITKQNLCEVVDIEKA